MSDFTIGYVKPRTDEEYQAAIDEMLAELERSATRSQETRKRTKRAMAEMEASKTRSAVIEARIDARLKTLAKWVTPDVG